MARNEFLQPAAAAVRVLILFEPREDEAFVTIVCNLSPLKSFCFCHRPGSRPSMYRTRLGKSR